MDMQKAILIFLFCLGRSVLTAQPAYTGIFNQPVMPGPSGVYLLMLDSGRLQPAALRNREFVISRTDRKKGGFAKLATIRFPASAGEFEAGMDKDLLQEILRKKQFSSAQDLYQQLAAGRLDTLGLYLLLPPVLQALGMLYIDQEIRGRDENISYKVEIVRNGSSRLLYSTGLRDLHYTPLPVFRKYRVLSSDSALMVTWYAVQNRAQFARVYSLAGNKEKPESLQYVFTIRDTLFVVYSAPSKRGDRISLFIRPTDFPGNMGRPSDTVHVLAQSMHDLASIRGLTARDTLGGILLTWDEPARDKFYTGIRVLKSRFADSGYVSLDTLPASATAYLDRRIIRGVQYYYSVLPIRYDLPQAKGVTPANVAAFARQKSTLLLAPQGVHASFTKERNIRISWHPNSGLNLFAYYVLRGTSSGNLKVISPAVRDTVFVDSLQNLNAATTYLYAVRAMDLDMQWSDTSALVPVFPPKARVVTAPAGLIGRYSASGVSLHWNEVSRNDPSVAGYIIYKREKGEKYFTALTPKIIRGEYYVDSAIQQSGIFEYACASVDFWNNQSILSPLAVIHIEGSAGLYPPFDFEVRNIAAGIAVSVPSPLDAASLPDRYVIYRRMANERSYKKVAEVPVRNAQYVDKQVIVRQLYVYVISAKDQSGESKKTGEKSIRRK
jgi:hypothetical protein